MFNLTDSRATKIPIAKCVWKEQTKQVMRIIVMTFQVQWWRLWCHAVLTPPLPNAVTCLQYNLLDSAIKERLAHMSSMLLLLNMFRLLSNLQLTTEFPYRSNLLDTISLVVAIREIPLISGYITWKKWPTSKTGKIHVVENLKKRCRFLEETSGEKSMQKWLRSASSLSEELLRLLELLVASY